MNTSAAHSGPTIAAPHQAVRGFVPALEGMRGLAALAVIVTHAAFQTGAVSVPVLGRVWGRFDLAVAVFFALSGFLLWRGHAAAARGFGDRPGVGRYYLHRAVRILPAYWVVVVVVLVFLPSAGGGWKVWLANLGLVQVFVPLTLTDGLTQMWSLSVEVAFYLLLPLIAFALARLRGSAARWRIPVLLTAMALSLGWGFVPVPTPDGIHADNWLPGYLPWFGAGMVLAELVMVPEGPVHRFVSRRRPMAVIAAISFGLACTELAGPEGLQRAQPWQYAVKIVLGAVLAFSLLAPLVFGARHRWLGSPTALAVGRWSYGLFIWHLLVLSIVFPVFGIVPFDGSFVFVFVVTVVLSLAVASASYALVEEPARVALARWEAHRRSRRDAALDTGTADQPTATTPTSADS